MKLKVPKDNPTGELASLNFQPPFPVVWLTNFLILLQNFSLWFLFNLKKQKLGAFYYL